MTDKKNNLTLKRSKTKSHPFWSFFWLTFLVVSLWYAWYSFYVPSNNEIWSSDIELSKEIANNSNKNILVFFTGKWCSPCRIMKREVLTDSKVMKAIDDKFVRVEINIDDPNSEALVKQYNIGATPTTIFIDPKGNVIDYAVGKVDKSKFLDMLLGIQFKNSLNKKNMKKVIYKTYGSPEVLEIINTEKPSPKPNEVLVKIRVSSATRADTMMRKGSPEFGRLYLGLFKPQNTSLGTGFSGIIEAIGKKVTNFKIDDVVFGEKLFSNGSNSDYICIAEDMIIEHKPRNVSYEAAAPICDGFLTSYNFLIDIANIK